jgi:outer membrane murein-binding lipoprotein Lpp
MDEDRVNEGRDRMEAPSGAGTRPTGINLALMVVAALLVIATGFSIGYGYYQKDLVHQRNTQVMQMNATVGQLRNQLDAITTKMNEMTAAQQTAPANAAAANAATDNGAKPSIKKSATKRTPAVDKRYKQFQTQLDEQKKQLAETKDEVAKNRSDLEGNLSSTRDELNGSIAKTHEELVALAKRGERNYAEFTLVKSKQFSRVGPITLSLRKADTKHKNFDVEMIVDDNELSKKKVNLYEPIWIHRQGDPQPVQVVVNRVDKNEIQGYVSSPKYKNSDLESTLTPVSATAPANPSVGGNRTPDSSQAPPQ